MKLVNMLIYHNTVQQQGLEVKWPRDPKRW